MLSRKFTTREKVLLLVMAIMLLGLFYYQVVYKQTEHMIAEYDTIDLENELTIVQGKAARKKKMEQEMAEGGQKANGEVATIEETTFRFVLAIITVTVFSEISSDCIWACGIT